MLVFGELRSFVFIQGPEPLSGFKKETNEFENLRSGVVMHIRVHSCSSANMLAFAASIDTNRLLV